MDKRTTLQEAVEAVPSGCTLALGGMTLYRRPMAFVKALLQRYAKNGEPNGLTLLAFTASLESDLLVGSGMVKRIRSCYFGLEIFGLAPMFTYLANHGEIEIVEETEMSLALGLRAQMAGIGFMPGRAWQGTDLPRLRPDVRTILDPYRGEELMAFPAICPDVTVIHVLRADAEGNAQIGDNKGVDEELMLTSKLVILTADEIVDGLAKADLVAPFVHMVIPAPYGAAPTSCHPLYAMDGEEVLAYAENVTDPASYKIFLDNWIHQS